MEELKRADIYVDKRTGEVKTFNLGLGGEKTELEEKMERDAQMVGWYLKQGYPIYKRCKYCGTAFRPDKHHKYYCSTGCQKKRHSEYVQRKYWERKERTRE